ncbi:MAG: calycin-like domain-containing protein [Bacteroidales bacterium]|nr:calycin-like domain-containing protein [Bacteroidales bacterium]
MKKIFTLFASVAAFMAASATDYTAPMVVEIMGSYTDPAEATISLTEESNGTYTFTLKNFSLVVGTEAMNIGNIEATGVPGIVTNGLTVIDADAHAVVTAGDDSSIAWTGPNFLPNGVDLEIYSLSNGESMELTLEMEVLGMEVEVYFGQRTIDGEQKGYVEVEYNEPLAVQVYGQIMPQENSQIVITIKEDDPFDGDDDDVEHFDLELKNFVFYAGTDPLYFGNVVVENLTAGYDATGAVMLLDSEATASITNGDLDGVPMWMGPILCPNGVPVKISGTATIFDLEAKINLTVEGVGDMIVYYGTETVAAAGISSVVADSHADGAIYDMHGMQVDRTMPGTIYIKRGADGSATKFIAR